MEYGEESRLYHRFIVNQENLCFVMQNGTLLGNVYELSYGGLSLAGIPPTKTGNSKPTPKELENLKTVELYFLDKSISCQVEEKYQNPNRQGYQLIHEQTQVLTFLKEIISWIRAGAALAYLEKQEREGFDGELPEYLNFDGPIPVEIEWGGIDGQKIPNFLLSLQQDKVTYQLTRKNGQLLTAHNVWPGAESGEMRMTTGLDSQIVRMGLAVLVGLSSDTESELYPKLIQLVLNLYDKNQQESLGILKRKTG
jgi:hypothetical protein